MSARSDCLGCPDYGRRDAYIAGSLPGNWCDKVKAWFGNADPRPCAEQRAAPLPTADKEVA